MRTETKPETRKMLPRNLNETPPKPATWQELSEGTPTIVAFAQLCSLAIVATDKELNLDQLSDESKTILSLAAERGAIEIRVHRDNYDSIERFLAVCVEVEPEQRRLFLRKEDPQQTVRFLDGFRELCRKGLILHHLQRDFSLSNRGFEIARSIDALEYQHLAEFAIELD